MQKTSEPGEATGGGAALINIARFLLLMKPVLVHRMVELAMQYGRYGYRRITALLQQEGFKVNHKRVERFVLGVEKG